MLKLSKEELNRISCLTLENLKKALDFITNNNLKEYANKMQYVMYLTGYYILANGIQENNLVDWVKDTKFENLSNGQRREVYMNLINNIF